MSGTVQQQGAAEGWDPDSPDNPTLTPRGLQRLLNVSRRWEERYREKDRIIGQTRAGTLYRYIRAEVVQAMLNGQVLRERVKPAPLGLPRSRVRRLKRGAR